jgi:hypothetical protein
MIPELELLCDKLKSRVDSKRIYLEFPSETSLRIVPAAQDSFSLEVSFENGLYEVSAAKWLSEFDQLEQASAAICWLLTPYYRIVRSAKSGSDIATWIEIYTNEGWEGTRYVYFVDPSTLQSPIDDADEIVILQQAVFLDSAFETYYPAAHLDEARYPVGTILGETTYSNHSGDWAPVGVPIAE